METWQLQEAKNKFSEVVNLAVAGRPQVVTRHGKPVAVISSIEDYAKAHPEASIEKPKNFVEFLLSMPKIAGDDEDLFVRVKGGKMREIDWE
jgi:antitoxin Phd